MASNISAHRITYGALLLRGAVAGVVSAVVMAVVAMLGNPLIAEGTDAWSFPKVISTIVLGQGAADPLAGFEAVPVAVGLVTHLAMGALFGAVFAGLIGMFNIQDRTPVMIAGIVYGAVVFIAAYVAIGRLLFPAFEEMPIIVGFWSHVAFGIIAGFMLGSWSERYDLGPEPSTSAQAVDAGRDPETLAISVLALLVLVAVVGAALAVNPIVALAIAAIVIAVFAAATWGASRRRSR